MHLYDRIDLALEYGPETQPFETYDYPVRYGTMFAREHARRLDFDMDGDCAIEDAICVVSETLDEEGVDQMAGFRALADAYLTEQRIYSTEEERLHAANGNAIAWPDLFGGSLRDVVEDYFVDTLTIFPVCVSLMNGPEVVEVRTVGTSMDVLDLLMDQVRGGYTISAVDSQAVRDSLADAYLEAHGLRA